MRAASSTVAGGTERVPGTRQPGPGRPVRSKATGRVLSASQRSALLSGQEICRDFHGAELEPFQLALIETLGVTPVNYEPVGPVREAARARVTEALKHGPRFERDRLYEKARLWLYESGQR